MPADPKLYRIGVPVTLACPPFHSGKIVAKAEAAGAPPSSQRLYDLVAVRWRSNNKVELVDWRLLVTPAHGPAGIRVFKQSPRPRYGRIALPRDKTPGVARLMSAASRLSRRVVVVWDDGTRSIEKIKDITPIQPAWAGE